LKTWKSRVHGDESPYIPLGVFKVRLPFIHYKWEWPDYLQGLLMCAVDLAAIPLIMELLGMPFEAAIAIVILNGLLYLVHHLLGDPVVPGWITPAIPLLMIYVNEFPMGPERVQALMAFQMMLGMLSIILGLTNLATKVVHAIPTAIKSGIVMGAGIAAVVSVFEQDGRFDQFPWTTSIAVGVAFYLIYSKHYASLRTRHHVFQIIAKLGIFPIILLAVIVAPMVNESAWPVLEWGITQPDFHL
ncbi:unnamed protein product, partial [Chrysoparadoxa australica]